MTTQYQSLFDSLEVTIQCVPRKDAEVKNA
jgi:hypothetical protein